METRFAFPIRESYPARRRRALLGIPGTHGVCGARMTPVTNRPGRGVIVSRRTRCAGRRDHDAHGTSEEIRCAPDLILAQGERMDG